MRTKFCRILAPSTLAGKLLPALEDAAPGQGGEEGRSVGDEDGGPLLDWDTGPHLQGIV